MTRKVRLGGTWVEVGVGGTGSDGPAFLPSYLPDRVAEPGTSRPTSAVVTPGTINTWGAWLGVVESLSDDASGITIQITNGTGLAGVDTSRLLQVGIGASGSEVPWATVAIGYGAVDALTVIPGFIPAGSRVSLRSQGVQTARTSTVLPLFLAKPAGATTRAPTTYGVDTSTSRGVTLTAPDATHTKSAWTEIVAATTGDHDVLCATVQGAGVTTMVNALASLDIAIGAPGSEIVVVRNLPLRASSQEIVDFDRHPMTARVPTIPAGTRIAARYATPSLSNGFDLSLVAA